MIKTIFCAMTACLLCASVSFAQDQPLPSSLHGAQLQTSHQLHGYMSPAAIAASQWVTGCCDHEPLPSDHLWDDYCAEKGCKHGLFGHCGQGCGGPACSRWRHRNTGRLLHHPGCSSCERPVSSCSSCAASGCAAGGCAAAGCADAGCSACGKQAPKPAATAEPHDAVPPTPPVATDAVPRVQSVPVPQGTSAPFQAEQPAELQLPKFD